MPSPYVSGSLSDQSLRSRSTNSTIALEGTGNITNNPSDDLRAGKRTDDSYYNAYQGSERFDLSSIPETAIVTSASYTMYVDSVNTGAGDFTYRLYTANYSIFGTGLSTNDWQSTSEISNLSGIFADSADDIGAGYETITFNITGRNKLQSRIATTEGYYPYRFIDFLHHGSGGWPQIGGPNYNSSLDIRDFNYSTLTIEYTELTPGLVLDLGSFF